MKHVKRIYINLFVELLLMFLISPVLVGSINPNSTIRILDSNDQQIVNNGVARTITFVVSGSAFCFVAYCFFKDTQSM